ncbi:MAG: DUF4364 family protein [Eubacteriales bacterium]
MAHELKIINKLIILYLLHKIDFSITRKQIYNFILITCDYTNFDLLQEAIVELEETEMIENCIIKKQTFVQITAEGINTLTSLKSHLTPAIRQDIDQKLYEQKFAMQKELSIQAVYDKSSRTQEYEAYLTAKDGKIPLIELKLSLPSEELAANVCKNWKEKSETIYQYLTEQLF